MLALKKISALKLFGNGIVASLLAAILFTNILSAYKSMPITDEHTSVFYPFWIIVIIYSTGVYWLHMQHRKLFKVILIPVLLFLSCIIGLGINNLLLTPLFLSVPMLTAIIHNWAFNMFWFIPFSTALAVTILFYTERVFFNWVRAGNNAE